MRFRKIHINSDVWKYCIGSQFILIRNNNKRILIKKKDIFLDSPEQARKREESIDEWSKYSWDRYVIPSDFGIDESMLNTITPSTIKNYIIETQYKG